jgi:hypothetical protein
LSRPRHAPASEKQGSKWTPWERIGLSSWELVIALAVPFLFDLLTVWAIGRHMTYGAFLIVFAVCVLIMWFAHRWQKRKKRRMP